MRMCQGEGASGEEQLTEQGPRMGEWLGRRE